MRSAPPTELPWYGITVILSALCVRGDSQGRSGSAEAVDGEPSDPRGFLSNRSTIFAPEMTNARPERQLFGQVMTGLPPAELASVLERAGLCAGLAQSTHKGARVWLDAAVGDADCEIQPHRPGEYLVCNAGGESGALEDMARGLSTVLAALGIRHRLDLSDVGQPADLYLHHDWPLGDGVME